VPPYTAEVHSDGEDHLLDDFADALIAVTPDEGRIS
jgi:hypothetical protein